MAIKTQTHKEKTGNTSLTHSLITSIIIGAILFAFLLLAFEGISRTEWFSRTAANRSLGIYHSQFEIKWFKLEDYVRQNGGVDVLLLGSSIVNTGIDPDVLSSEYEKLTGEHLRIFNFGIEGLTVSPTSVVAKILVEKYHPSTILFITEMRDYVAINGLTVENQLFSDEWFSLQEDGVFSLNGWLRLNSNALEYLLPFRNWSRPDFKDTYQTTQTRWNNTSASGYEADHKSGKDIDVHPDLSQPEEAQKYAMFHDFSIYPGRLENLKTILNPGDNVQLSIVTEIPPYPTYFDYFGGTWVHKMYLEDLKTFVEQNGGVFMPPLDWEMIPLTCRVDNHHLNDYGAKLYSTLLAEQLAWYCQVKNMCPQPSTTAGVEQ